MLLHASIELEFIPFTSCIGRQLFCPCDLTIQIKKQIAMLLLIWRGSRTMTMILRPPKL